ncbi:hypothetical protein GPL15_04460 [Clostridium sp. MCC353]|nr:hypothetical protein [Clostridium sp. MCC353]
MWKNRKRIAASLLSAALLSCTTAAEVLAGPPAVDTDEALYVNLDYYGSPQETSIVKGCSLNGIRSFTDYGTYNDVTNMSNYAQPVVTQDGVSWELEQDVKERFYYECQLDNDSVILPWTFDISYKLNGVPIEAQKLVGADGLVEIDVECIPNEAADDYYKNNMILQVGTLVDMEDVNSVSAPGSQTQSIGTYKAIIFAAVPGQEKTFHIEIGTSNFETMGIIMLMIPGTLDQMKEIKDIKEVKDTVSDSTDELLDGMDEILDKLDRVTSGMDSTKEGLAELKKAKENFDAAKDNFYANADQGLDELQALSGKIGELAPDINNSKETLDQISTDLDHMVDTLTDASDGVGGLSAQLDDLHENLDELKYEIGHSNSDKADSIADIINGKLDELENTLDQLEEGMSGSGEELDGAAAGEAVEKLNDIMAQLSDQLGGYVDPDQLAVIMAQLGSLDPDYIPSDLSQINDIFDLYREAISSARNLMDRVKEITKDVKAGGRSAVGDTSSVAGKLSDVLDDMDSLISNVYDLNKTVNENKDSFHAMLDHAAETAVLMSEGSNSLVNALRVVQQTAKNNREAVESGTDKTLDGLIDIFEKAAEPSSRDKVKDATHELKDSVKNEIDKVEDETNLLNLDVEEEMISFTSDKNPAPDSIQVILRTQEISEESLNTNAIDIEPAEVEVGIWAKIVNVFKKIWEAVMSIFS